MKNLGLTIRNWLLRLLVGKHSVVINTTIYTGNGGGIWLDGPHPEVLILDNTFIPGDMPTEGIILGVVGYPPKIFDNHVTIAD